MPSGARKLRIFLCHSSHDKLIVRELYDRLSAEGWIDAWLDSEKLYPGQDWNLEIEKAVEAADVIIVCLSMNSITKEGYVQRELRIVLDLADYKPEGTLFVIPVRLEDCEPPRRLRSWQYADYFPQKDREHAYARLLASLRMRAQMEGIFSTHIIKPKPLVNIDGEVKERTRKDINEKKDEVFDKKAPQIQLHKNKTDVPILMPKGQELIDKGNHLAEDIIQKQTKDIPINSSHSTAAEQKKKEAKERAKNETEMLTQREWELKNSVSSGNADISAIPDQYPQTKRTFLVSSTIVFITLFLCSCIVLMLIWQYGDQILHILGIF